MNVIIENSAIALPRSTGPHISTKTPGELLSAADAKVPVRKRPTSNPAKVFVKAHKKLKAK